MACRVVCISRALAAGGEDIGRRVAEELGFRYVDEEIIMRAADKAGVPAEVVEQTEHSRPMIMRILENMAAYPIDPGAMPMDQFVPTALGPKYEFLIADVIRETAAEGNVVIVAHGASIPLAGLEGLLRVLVTAPAETRAKALAAGGFSEKEAAKVIAKSDGERKDFLRRFYDVKEELPTHYDVVVNTERLSEQTAAKLVVHAAKG
jgi:cytidylate kinase